ncbi:MAG: HlyD family type I secretion periplasmic adaptor subunit [Hyphomonadaceae bacterium]|nr:HlyD family type I secretion periplasmic adaptor subunit [Hyphomonadaceae bacterium]
MLTDDPAIEARWGYTLIAVFFGAFLGWAMFAPLDAAVVGQGAVKVSGNREVIQHRDGGVIARIAVAEGDKVARGQVLMDLAAHELIAQERALAGLVLELEASRERLTAELEGRSVMNRPASWSTLSPADKAMADEVFTRQSQELRARTGAYSGQAAVIDRRTSQLATRSQGYRDELVALDRQGVLVDEELKAMRELAEEGFAPLARVRALERTRAEIDARRIEVASQMAQASEGVGESQAQVVSIRQDRREAAAAELRQVSERLIDAIPKLAEVRGAVERAQVRAPTSGTVVGLAFFNDGAVVAPGERIADIVPDQSELVVEAKVSTHDADDLAIGDKAEVRFTAFEGRSFARANGGITRISADSFQDERSGAEYFKVQVQVGVEELQRLAQKRGETTLPLRPGLPAEIVVPIRKRTALQYIMEPLDQSVWKSFREH